jgi:cell division septal protein FtsQ
MRWGRVAAVAGVAALVVAPVWGPPVLRPFGFFAVRRIELVGVRHLSPAAVTGALGLRRGASVWDPLGGLAARVRRLPGVAEAEVARRLPGTLRVTVTEVEPVALASGVGGLVPVGRDGRPLPYDPARAALDLPVVQRAEPSIVAALGAIQAADPTFFAEVASARGGPAGSLELDVEGLGRVRLALPIEAAVVQAVAAVERDLASRAQAWRELDGRYAGWVVVRRASKAEAKS